MTDAGDVRQRIDTWLWAARFYKTRSLAADAVDGGKVRWNGQATKPARALKSGDELEISVGELRWTVVVRGPVTSSPAEHDVTRVLACRRAP